MESHPHPMQTVGCGFPPEKRNNGKKKVFDKRKEVCYNANVANE